MNFFVGYLHIMECNSNKPIIQFSNILTFVYSSANEKTRLHNVYNDRTILSWYIFISKWNMRLAFLYIFFLNAEHKQRVVFADSCLLFLLAFMVIYYLVKLVNYEHHKIYLNMANFLWSTPNNASLHYYCNEL